MGSMGTPAAGGQDVPRSHDRHPDGIGAPRSSPMMSTRPIASLRRTFAACAVAAILLSGGLTFAQSSNAASDRNLAGVWFVQVTLRNCTTQAPMGTFNSLGTYHRGGTLSESTTASTFAI